jgi:hypothetical protein
LYFLKSTVFSPVFKLTLVLNSRNVLNLSVREDYFKMTDRPKGFVLTPSRLGKPPNTEEASAAKPVFTGDVNKLPATVLYRRRTVLLLLMICIIDIFEVFRLPIGLILEPASDLAVPAALISLANIKLY